MRILIRGLPSFNDHIPSGFHLAMDGYFCVSTGDKGILGAVGTDGRKIEMRGGIYRMRPDGTGLEVYCTGTRNHLDVSHQFRGRDVYRGQHRRRGRLVDARTPTWWTAVFTGIPTISSRNKPYTLWMMTDFGAADGRAHRRGLPTMKTHCPRNIAAIFFLCDWAGAWVMRVRLKRTGSTYQVESRVVQGNQPRKRRGGSTDFLTRGDSI